MKSTGIVFVLATMMMAGSSMAQQAAPASATVVAQQTPQRTPAPAAEMKGRPAPQGFSVVLVLGDLTGSANADPNVPPAARKALNDMKDFLPYKGYRLLDAEWILGSHSATTRLRGPDGQDYELTLNNSPMSSPSSTKEHVTFRLRDAGSETGGDMTMASARTAERAAVEQRIQALEREIAAAQRSGEKSPEATARAKQLAELRQRLESEPAVAYVYTRGRWIIDTSFEMEIGETVVVGTSRLKDTGKENGRALIALLTAVPKNGAAGGRQE